MALADGRRACPNFHDAPAQKSETPGEPSGAAYPAEWAMMISWPVPRCVDVAAAAPTQPMTMPARGCARGAPTPPRSQDSGSKDAPSTETDRPGDLNFGTWHTREDSVPDARYTTVRDPSTWWGPCQRAGEKPTACA